MRRPLPPAPPIRLRETLAVPFALLRVPLYALDRQLVRRLDPQSTLRVAFDCGLGTVDILAGHALGDESISRYGAGRIRIALHPDHSGSAPLAPEPPQRTLAPRRQ